jgi:hypothetical protein
MQAAGFGGFEVQPSYPLAIDGQPAGVKNLQFLSPEFLDDLKFVSTKAADTGLRMDLTLSSGWPYGGSIFSAAEGAGRLRIERIKPSQDQSELPTPKLRDNETLLAAFAGNTQLPIANNLVHLPPDKTSPSTILFFISSRTGMQVKRPSFGAEGYVLDHQSLPAVNKFITQIADKELQACADHPPYSVFCDSLESYGEDWTDNFLTEFQTRRGYDLRPLLPALTTDIGPKTLEIRHDWGQTLTELFNDSFVKPLQQAAHDHNTRFRIQAYGIPSAGQFSYADADLPEGEGYQWHDYRATRYASSACHLMGIPVSSSETFTWLHSLVFRATPLDIKAEADLHFLQGVNQIICHGWPYTPPQVASPGWSFYAAAVFDEKNPWFIAMPDITRYLTRVSATLRLGKPANDIALYLPNDDAWAHFTPGHVSLTDALGKQLGKQIVGQILDAGYNLDFFDDQMLSRFGTFDGGQLAFNTLRYKVILLPGVERCPLATLRKLEAFAKAGGTVIATRRLPSLAPGYTATDADTAEVQSISQRLFLSPNAPGIFLHDESKLAATLAPRLAPDVAMLPPSPQVGVVHRHTDDAEIYFLANTANTPLQTTATFRVQNLFPQICNPLTGQITPAPILDRSATGTSIKLTLAPYESTFILWTATKLPAPAQTTLPAPIDLTTDWTLQFSEASTPVSMPTLRSWTADDSTKNFSGVCTYTKHLPFPAAAIKDNLKVALTFGTGAPRASESSGPGYQADFDAPVREAAIVFINGHRAGSVWCPPYSLEVGPWLTTGDNEIRIQVANTAVNNIAAKGFPNYDNNAITAEFGNRFTPPSAHLFQPVPSGLLGPIQLH